MSQPISQIISFLDHFAPLDLAEEWDNVGLLIGDETTPIQKIMTCLTLTPDVAEEAIRKQAGLIVSHHPVLFRAVKKLTSRNSEGKMLLDLISQGVAVYSPHTAFDSAAMGINQRLAEGLELTEIQPIRISQDTTHSAGLGSGRFGKLKTGMILESFLNRVKDLLEVPHLQYVGELTSFVETVGVACGSAAEFVGDAHQLGCDVFLTGEGRFHACLEARSLGIPMILAGHYATERPAVEQLSSVLQQQYPDFECWASEVESDPVKWSVG